MSTEKRVVTQEDLDRNPDFVSNGVQIGDTVEFTIEDGEVNDNKTEETTGMGNDANTASATGLAEGNEETTTEETTTAEEDAMDAPEGNEGTEDEKNEGTDADTDETGAEA